jgi:hypothetical protein
MRPGTRLRTTLAALTLALLSACAQRATARGLTVPKAELPGAMNPDLAGKIAVTGTTTDKSWDSKIDDVTFREALVASLRLAGFLAKGSTAPLTLSARLVRAEHVPGSWGIDITIKTIVRYTLLDAESGSKVIDEPVTATHTATFSDAALGFKRASLAHEVSARKNIAAAIERINSIRRVEQAAPSM